MSCPLLYTNTSSDIVQHIKQANIVTNNKLNIYFSTKDEEAFTKVNATSKVDGQITGMICIEDSENGGSKEINIR